MEIGSKWHNRLTKLVMQKMGFVRTVIPFKGMKSQTHTRQMFLDRNVSNLKCCGKRENRVANKW